MTRITLICSVVIALAQASADADMVLDFETTPTGGTPTDNQALSPPYVDLSGANVHFGLDADGDNVIDSDAIFEQVGNTDTTNGFLNDTLGVHDTAAPGFESQLGNFFLRSDTLNTVSPEASFVIQFSSLTGHLVTAASGEIWDIDGTNSTNTEQYLVTAYDALGNILGTQLSPLGTQNGSSSLDGKPWEFSFVGLNQPLDRIELSFTGSKTTGLGLAFDNFAITTQAVPEPSSLILTGLVSSLFFGGGALRRRRNRASKAA